METATLTSPPRPVMVQPVQKSLSLPSYARAGGEGIDHKLIFAALEQREKVRRKSKIFKEKEKTGTTRQNYFCLPLPSGNKCRETSFSSDTSCSSLEFQKPKSIEPPVKTTKNDCPNQNGIKESEIPAPNLNSTAKLDLNNNSDEGKYVPPNDKEYSSKERPSRREASRSTIGSSDSMERTERSSKSSTDSLSRKERLVAIKARVEAERERKLCDSSSEEEETSLRITRHNSDGVIHRTVREVKTKSSRSEKRFRRRAPEESAARRATRKQHKSLYLPPSIDLDAWKPPIIRSGSSFSLQKDLDEINKDFYNIENSLICHSVPKDSYFSDICSGSYRSRFVKPMIDEIEAKEQRLKAIRDNLTMNKSSVPLQNSRSLESNEEIKLDYSFHSNLIFDAAKKQNSRFDSSFEIPKKCVSPVSRAPTPPPRSPKSIEFVNKVLLQHQSAPNSNFYNEACSLERKRTILRPKISPPSTLTQQSSFDMIKRDLHNSRRKTCSNFSQVDEITPERPKTPSTSHQAKFLSQHFPPRSPDLSHKFSGVGRKIKSSDIPNMKVEIQGKRWEKREVDSEKKFNSLEKRTNANEPDWTKWRFLPKNKRNFPCTCAPTDLQDCNCNQNLQLGCNTEFQEHLPLQAESSPKLHHVTNKFTNSSPERLSESEVNITQQANQNLSSPETKKNVINSPLIQETEENSLYCFASRKDATENLNTAMEELESVYRSLRISTENLSEKNNSPSPSKAKIDTNISNLHEVKTAVYCNGSVSEYNIQNINYSRREKSEFYPHSTSFMDSPSVNEALCIEELFGDLTQQLDLEQKLLQETRCKKLPSSPTQKRTVECKTSSKTNLQEENCSEFDVDQIFAPNDNADKKSSVDLALTNIKEREMVRKKHKAVRSLSENIASLMLGKNSSLIKSEKGENGQCEKSRKTSLDMIGKMSDNVDRMTTRTSSRNESVSTELTKHSDPDEIWQIRVSMDPGNPPEDPPLVSKNASAHLRLHSALRIPNENIVHRDELEASQCLKQNSTPVSTRGRSDVLLSENELEKLLTTLLRDVSNKPISEKKLPSPQTKEMTEKESTITSKGEMLVMQHLDVIRNYDPS